MMTLDRLMSFDQDALPEVSKTIHSSDLPQLVNWLSEKNDKIRYQAFLLLQYRSQSFNDVFPFWAVFLEKLGSDNSYQRSIGLMLIAENAKWDLEHRLDDSIQQYLELLHDEKPITIRQCIQSLKKIVPCNPGLCKTIADHLISMDMTAIRETMRKSILTDILTILAVIRNYETTDEIESFIIHALSGEVLDQKSKKQLRALLFP